MSVSVRFLFSNGKYIFCEYLLSLIIGISVIFSLLIYIIITMIDIRATFNAIRTIIFWVDILVSNQLLIGFIILIVATVDLFG